jgi:endonuclease G, mitochondrial
MTAAARVRPVCWLVMALAASCCTRTTLSPLEDRPDHAASGPRRPHLTHDADASSVSDTAQPTALADHPSGSTDADKVASRSVHLALGIPRDKDPSDDTLMVKPQYALSYNASRNVANWVSWNLNGSHFGNAPRHRGKFIPDETLSVGLYRVRHDDYSNSGYDRGHMVRSEERTASVQDNAATFLTTNILPQTHELNAGPWLRLEEYCQHMAQRDGKELYLMAGGIYEKRPIVTIGHGVAVSDKLFKIAVVLERGQGAGSVTESTRVLAVIMPNATGVLNHGWAPYRTTVDRIELETGYDFLPDVPEPIQRVIEARLDKGPAE